MIYIDFFGGTHGNFLSYSINALDDTVKQIDPFNQHGASHNPYKKTLSVANHFSLDNIPVPDTTNMISIVVDTDDCLLVNLLNFGRCGPTGILIFVLLKLTLQKKFQKLLGLMGFTSHCYIME